MEFTYNGTTVKDVTYNGNTVNKVTYNGTTVWQRAFTAPYIAYDGGCDSVSIAVPELGSMPAYINYDYLLPVGYYAGEELTFYIPCAWVCSCDNNRFVLCIPDDASHRTISPADTDIQQITYCGGCDSAMIINDKAYTNVLINRCSMTASRGFWCASFNIHVGACDMSTNCDYNPDEYQIRVGCYVQNFCDIKLKDGTCCTMCRSYDLTLSGVSTDIYWYTCTSCSEHLGYPWQSHNGEVGYSWDDNTYWKPYLNYYNSCPDDYNSEGCAYRKFWTAVSCHCPGCYMRITANECYYKGGVKTHGCDFFIDVYDCPSNIDCGCPTGYCQRYRMILTAYTQENCGCGSCSCPFKVLAIH